MAAHKFVLTSELVDRIATLASDLHAEAAEHQEAFEERSEKWQEGDAGTEVGAWIERLDALADELDGIDEEP